MHTRTHTHTHTHVCTCRSKEDILSEIRRLQSEMSALEERVQSSVKVMNGSAAGHTEATAGSTGARGRPAFVHMCVYVCAYVW